MTSRQRMLAALEGRKPDCVPVAPYFWGEEYSWKLVGRPIWRLSLGGAETSKDILRALHDRHDIDWVISLSGGNGFLAGKEVEEREGRIFITDHASRRRWEYLLDGRRLVELDDSGRPLPERSKTTGALHDPITSREEADRWFDKRGFRRSEPGAESPPAPEERDWKVQQYGDRYLVVGVLGGGFHQLCYAVGLETALIMLHDAPAIVAYMLERFMAEVPRRAQRMAALGHDAGFVVDSYASADIISPRDYADWIAPVHRAHAQAIKGAGLKAIFYNTGNILPLLPTIKTLGFDGLSFEERSKGVEMDIEKIRREVGPAQCLFGNFDAYLLLRGDREAIAREVARQVNATGRQGAFIMGTGSPICDATDPDVVDYWIAQARGSQS